MKRILLLVAILLVPGSLFCGERRQIPITITADGLIIMTVGINGKPASMILDTAATTAVDSRLGLAESENQTVETVTAFSRSTRRVAYASPTFELGGSFLAGHSAMVRKMEPFDRLCGRRISGSLGYDLLRGWKLVIIDYQHKILILER